MGERRVITNVYVDGFNLFYGALRRTSYRWLDLGTLCQVLLPNDAVRRIRYFTARVNSRPDDPGKSQRQDVYLRALVTIPELNLATYMVCGVTCQSGAGRVATPGSVTVGSSHHRCSVERASRRKSHRRLPVGMIRLARGPVATTMPY